MVLAAYFFEGVTHCLAEVFIGIEDHPGRVELDHRHRATDRRQLGVGLAQSTTEALDFEQVRLVM
ncbi:hypothetical protein D3C81_2272230 [compost metagenome]